MKKYLFNRDYSQSEIPSIGSEVAAAIETISHTTGKLRVKIIWCSEDDCDCTGIWHQRNCKNHWTNQPNPEENIPY